MSGKKKKKKPGIAQGTAKYSMTLASFRIFVKVYVIAKMLSDQFKRAKQMPISEYFRGAAKGNEDAFTLMKLTEDDVNVVMKQLNPDSVELEAKNIYKKIVEKARAPRIIMGDKENEIKAVKEVFDNYIGTFKKGG